MFTGGRQATSAFFCNKCLILNHKCRKIGFSYAIYQYELSSDELHHNLAQKILTPFASSIRQASSTRRSATPRPRFAGCTTIYSSTLLSPCPEHQIAPIILVLNSAVYSVVYCCKSCSSCSIASCPSPNSDLCHTVAQADRGSLNYLENYKHVR